MLDASIDFLRPAAVPGLRALPLTDGSPAFHSPLMRMRMRMRDAIMQRSAAHETHGKSN